MKFFVLILLVATSLFAQERRNERFGQFETSCDDDSQTITLSKKLVEINSKREGRSYAEAVAKEDSSYFISQLELEPIWITKVEKTWEEKKVIDGEVKGDGSQSSFYDKYYDARNDDQSSAKEKRMALLDSLKGVSSEHASVLADKNFIVNMKRPSSWENFISQARTYEQKYNLNGLVSNLEDSAESNQRTLGYLVKGKVTTWEKKSEWVVRSKRTAQFEKVDIKINLNIEPLNKEKEVLTAKLSCDSRTVLVETANTFYNFNVNRQNTDYTLKGERKRINPSNFLQAKLGESGGNVALTQVNFNIDQAVLNDIKKNQGAVVVSGVIVFDKKQWNWFDKGTEVPFNDIEVTDFSSSVINTGIALDGREVKKVDLKYSISIKESRYFNNAKSNQIKL